MEEESDLIVLHKDKDLKEGSKEVKEVQEDSKEVKEEDSKTIELPETLETQE